jgi:amino-acid N-acetyltransferase
VNRSHVIHARVPGALLLELYSRDGLGTMVSADFYEGAAMTEVQFMNNTRASL